MITNLGSLVIVVLTLALIVQPSNAVMVELDDVVVVRTLHNGGTGVPEANLVEQYNARNDSSTYVWYRPYLTSATSFPDRQALMGGMLLAENGADLILEYAGWITNEMMVPSQLRNVSDMWEVLRLEETAAEPFSYACSGADGAKYAIPFTASFRVFFINSQHNTTIPETWQDVVAACDAHMEAKPGQPCFTLWALGGNTQAQIAGILDMLLAAMHGPEYVLALQRGSVSFSDGRYEESLEFLKVMFDKGYFEFTFSLAKFINGDSLYFPTLFGITKLLPAFVDPAFVPFMVPIPTLAFQGRPQDSFSIGVLQRFSIPALALDAKAASSKEFLQYLFSEDHASEMLATATLSWPLYLRPDAISAFTSDPIVQDFVNLAYSVKYIVPVSYVVITSSDLSAGVQGAVTAIQQGMTSAQAASDIEGIRAAEYLGKVLPASPSIAPGLYTGMVNLTLASSTPGAAIHYTLDGSPPFAQSPQFRDSEPILLVQDGSYLVRAVVRKSGLVDSEFWEGTYVIERPAPPPSPPSGSLLGRPVEESSSNKALVIGLGVALPLICCIAVILIFVMWRKSRHRKTVVTLAASGASIAFDEIKLIKKIGSGAYGDVHLGEWRSTRVAVKLLHVVGTGASGGTTTASWDEEMSVGGGSVVADCESGSSGPGSGSTSLSESQAKAFVAEAQVIMSLRHPHVVTFMGVSVAPPALVTEFLDRGALSQYVHNMAVDIDISACLQWSYEISAGVAFLHESGALHLDLKSLNVLLSASWTAKLCDFGLSTLTAIEPTAGAAPGVHPSGAQGEANDTTTALGTMYWTAPEVLRSGTTANAAPSVDVYSLAVVLYEIFSRSVPYEDYTNAFAVALRVSEGNLRPATKKLMVFRERAEVQRLMESAWDHDAGARPTALEMAQQLKRLCPEDPGQVVYPSSLGESEPTGEGYIVVVQFQALESVLESHATAGKAYVLAWHNEMEEVGKQTGGYVSKWAPHAVEYAFGTARQTAVFVTALVGLNTPLSVGIAFGQLEFSRDVGTLRAVYRGPVVEEAQRLAAWRTVGTRIFLDKSLQAGLEEALVLTSAPDSVADAMSPVPQNGHPTESVTSFHQGDSWVVEEEVVKAFLKNKSTRRIGLGSYSEAFVGILPGIESRVVFKKFILQRVGDTAYTVSIAAEFSRVYAARQSPHLVPVLGLSLAEGLLGYFVPYYPRGSIQSNLGKGQLSELRSVKGVRDLVVGQIKGLCAIAEHNLPLTVVSAWLSNAMLDQDGRVRIADYGFVTPSESLGTMTVSRTAAFEAPEILRGEVRVVSEPAVVYAFAMSLFELLTGATPFSGLSNALEVAMAVMGGERPEHDVRPELRASPEVGVMVRIIEMCWADDWEMRPLFSDLLGQLQPQPEG